MLAINKSDRLIRKAFALIAACAGVLAITTPSMAEPANPAIEKRYTRAFNECMATGEAAQGITSGLMSCYGEEIDRQDAKLNEAYKLVMNALSPARRDALKTAERAWIKSRERRCTEASGEEAQGTMEGIIYNGCVLDETIARLLILEHYH